MRNEIRLTCVFLVLLAIVASCAGPPVHLTENERKEVYDAVKEQNKKYEPKVYSEAGALKVVPAPAGLNGKVIEVNPSLGIIKINIGHVEGVRLGQQFEIRSATDKDKMLARAVVRWDQDDHWALATVEPGMSTVDVHIGDLVMPPDLGPLAARPKKSDEEDKRRKDIVTGTILTVKRPVATIVINGTIPPRVGDTLNVHRGTLPIGRVKIAKAAGPNWEALIIYEAENCHVSEGDGVTGYTYPEPLKR